MIKRYVVCAILFALSKTGLTSEDAFAFYSCPSIESGKACSRDCEKVGKISFDVRGEPEEGNVNVTLFTENEVAPETFKNCDISNSNNWNCQVTEVFQEQSHVMTNGAYFGKKIFRMLDGENDVSIYCARN